jgi:NTE family protein
MGIVNSSSLPKRKAFSAPNKIFPAFCVSLLSLAFLGCQNLETRPEANGTTSTVTTPGVRSPVRSQPENGNPPPQQTPPSQQTPVTTVPPNTPTVPATPAFLNKELPKVGVILGAGGMKTFAHLGVLRELQRARIPIHALVGLEWGAVIGGLYTMQAQANEAEWKSFKLKNEELPSNGFLSSRIKSAPISSLRPFFTDVFGSFGIDKSRVPFACPTYSLRTDRTTWQDRGLFKDAMTHCLPYPPLFQDNAGALAAPFAISESVAWLRAKGANVILLVNVMGQGETFASGLVSSQYSENLLWSEVRRDMLAARPPLVNWTINVNTTGHPITDGDARRALMEAGSKAATEVVNKMATQYGF